MIVALVDDNPAERDVTLPLLMQGFRDANVPVARFDFFSSGRDFLEHWKLGSYDLIVLDIIMGEGQLSGIEVAREIRKQNSDVRIIFCSSSNEYACESYTLNASFYIQKPASKESIADMIRRLNIADFELRRFVTLPDGQRVILRNIIYTEYSNHAIEIHGKRGQQAKTWMSQSQFTQLLEPYPYFVSCHKGILVNLHEVNDHTPSEFTMSDGTVLPISRRNSKKVEEAYQHFLFESVRKEMC